MTIGDVALVSTIAAWLLSVALPLVFPGTRVDATVSLSLMTLVGSLVALRQRQEEVRENG